jgi:hypothetical protein
VKSIRIRREVSEAGLRGRVGKVDMLVGAGGTDRRRGKGKGKYNERQ